MFESLKPFAGPAAIVFIEIGLSMAGINSAFWGGVMAGVGTFWFVIALFGNRALLKKMPWLLEWMPFLDPAGGVHSEPRDLTAKYISGHSFDISALARNARIIGRHFEDCDIYGPAVLAPTGIGHFVQCVFGPVEVCFIVTEQKKLLGPILVDGCTFKRCRFYGIGFVGSQDDREKFAKGASLLPPS